MKKADFWKNIWIPVKKRLPPEDWDKLILAWSYGIGEPMVIQAAVARIACQQLAEGQSVSIDKHFSHWTSINPPLENKSEKKNQNKRTPTDRKRV